MSYGYRRAEILFAMTNALALWVVAGAIIYEAMHRFRVAHPVSAPGMLLVALVGLAGNLVNGAVLAPNRDANLNLRVAFTHVLADAAAAVGTIAASFVILVTGWTQADAVASCGIAGLILAGSWPLLREAVQILMEGAPPHLSLPEVEEAMRVVPGVAGVHDLHIWSLTSGVEAVSGHVIVADSGDSQRVLQELCRLLNDRYGLGHVTLQVETEPSSDPGHPNCAPGVRTGPER
jgi:cobalt-zinc-cadmium efflux system protein